MKNLKITWIFIPVLLGCQQQPPPELKTNSVSSVASVQTTPTQFEVRDFKLDVKNDSDSTTYNGRGTLYSKDDSVRSGSYMVWIQAKKINKNDEMYSSLVGMRDGIGIFETFDYIRGNQRHDKPKVKYVDWNVAGYIHLAKAKIISSDVSQKTFSSSSEQLPEFEIRDFRISESGDKYFPVAKGRGTLVAKTDDLKIGRHIVWLESKRAHRNDDHWMQAVELQDGLGGFYKLGTISFFKI